MCDSETKSHFKEIKEMLYQAAVERKELRDMHQKNSTDIAVINNKLDKNDKDHEELKPLIKDHEKRIENEEKFSNQIKGGLKLIGIILSLGLLEKFLGGVK